MTPFEDSSASPEEMASAVLEGRRLELARLLTQVENDSPVGRAVLDRLFPHTGRAHLIGVTGAPGTGKSSLVNQLARYFRNPASNPDTHPQVQAARTPFRVAIVAVDPSSPFTGGAILGDRVRMRDLSGDPGVFIRSMASRGTLGGLAASTARFVQALDAAGFEIILIETVGAGQAEVDIARLAHTTLVVEAPGLGDDIQAIKAGILEIADILVINKADRPGVEAAERALRSMLQLAQPTPQDARHHGSIPEADPAQSASRSTISGIDPTTAWQTPIVKTVASEGAGIAELVETIRNHRHYLVQNGGWQQREQARLKVELDTLVRENLITGWRRSLPGGHYEQVLERLYRRDVSPRQAVCELLGVEK